MPLLETVNAMKENIGMANAIVAQLTPLHDAFTAGLKDLDGLDRSQVYFGLNEDGTATLLDFDPSSGSPRFNTALPLPAEAPHTTVVEPEATI